MSQKLCCKRKAECEAGSPRPAKAAKHNEPPAGEALSPAATLPGEVLGMIFAHLTPEGRIPQVGCSPSSDVDAHRLPSGSILRVNKKWRDLAKVYFTDNRQDILSAFYCRSVIIKNKLIDGRRSFHTFELRPVASDAVFSAQYAFIRFEAVFSKYGKQKTSLRIKVYGRALPGMLTKLPKNKKSVLLVEAENMDDPANDDDDYTKLQYCDLYTPQQIRYMVASIKKTYFNTSADATWLSEEAKQGLQRKIIVLNNIGGMIKEGLEDQAKLGDEAVGLNAMDMEDCYR